MKRSCIVLLASAVLLTSGFGLAGRGYADDPAPAKPAAQARTVQDVVKDIQAVNEELSTKVGPMQGLFSADKRKELSPVAIPLFKKLSVLLDELGTVEPKLAPDIDSQRAPLLAFLALMGDDDTVKDLTAKAKGDTPASIQAGLDLDMADWWKGKDVAAQTLVLDKLTVLAKAHPESDAIASTLLLLSHTNAANADISIKANDIIIANLTGKAATAMKPQVQAEVKLAANVGKPLVIAGKTPEGTDFTTADWKGKVILVDFWASWCGPCKAELPRVKAVYKDFHEKGLEVLGVDNDYSADDLAKFLAADPAMPWPHLFDPAAAADQKWNPITTGFGINGIPVMFLIDKKGILRSVEAREDFEDQIPKLLGEK